MARIHGAAKPQRKRKAKLKAAKSSRKEIPKSQDGRLRFPHLSHMLPAYISYLQHAANYTSGLRKWLKIPENILSSRTNRCAFCALLFQSLSAQKVEVDLRKPVHFILATSGPEKETLEELYNSYHLELLWEGPFKPGLFYSETQSLGYFMVTAILGSPAAQFISRRPPILDLVSQITFDQTKQWLQYCHSHHQDCPLSRTSFTPTRLIDVGELDGFPRLVESDAHSGHYVALSYCWGMNQSVKTTTGNIEKFSKQLCVSELQQTLKDTILTTRELGLRFLWIDSLCIIQDSDDDMAQELSRMHKVYANAYVTIVAASTKSCDEGFLQQRSQFPDDPKTVNFKAFSFPYRFVDGIFDEVTLQPFQSFHPAVEPVNRRAWTLQESLLSARLLIYIFATCASML